METEDKIICIVNKIYEMLKKGLSLQQITNITYSLREDGEDMIYFGWGTKSNNANIAYLVPCPIKSQKEYYKYFTEIGEGCISFSKYTLRIYFNRIEYNINKKVNGSMITIPINWNK
jgi:hypothetical protein